MPEPRFLTQWEREDYEREKRGEAPLGPFGRKGANAPEPTQEQIDAAAKAMFEAEQLARRGATEGDCRVLARIALAAAAALSPDKRREE